MPSNQFENIVQGDPNPAPGPTTEEQMALIRAWEAYAEASRQGITPHMAYIPGAGTSSVDELVRMLDRMMTEIRKLPKGDEAYVLSPLRRFRAPRRVSAGVPRLRGREAMGQRHRATLASQIGMSTDPARYRPDLAFSRRIDDLPPNHGVLLEIGVHGSTGGPLYGQDGQDMLWKYARFHGLWLCVRSSRGVDSWPTTAPSPAR